MSRAAEICKLYENGSNQRANFDTTYQEIIDHIDPHNRDITTQRAVGDRKNHLQFDGTALNAVNLFADFYQGSVFNQSTKWFSIRHEDKQVNEQPDNANWYDYARDTALQYMRNFYGPGGQAIGAWALFGNGPVLCEEVKNRKSYQAHLRYTSIPWGQYVMYEGEDGSVDQFIRCLKLPAHKIVSLFGADKCSDDIKECGTSEDTVRRMREFEILHAILPRDFQLYSKSAIKTDKDMLFESCWVERAKKNELKESGYRKFPVAIARYKLISGEVYARGLGEVALANAKTMNTMLELSLLRAGRELDPPLLVRRNSVVNGILNQQARGKTIVNDLNNSVKPLFEGSNLPAFEEVMKMMTLAINRTFHVEDILNILSHESPQQTAFQVNARLNLLQQILGPVFSQNDMSFFNPIIDVTIDNLAHMNLIGPPPDEIAMSGEGAYNFIYEGPLAQAQRNQELTNIQQCVADLGGVAQFYPDSIHMVDWDSLIRRVFDIRGTTDLLISRDDFAGIQKLVAQQKQAQQMAQVVGGGAEALGKVAPFIKASSEAAAQQQAAA